MPTVGSSNQTCAASTSAPYLQEGPTPLFLVVPAATSGVLVMEQTASWDARVLPRSPQLLSSGCSSLPEANSTRVERGRLADLGSIGRGALPLIAVSAHLVACHSC
mmetsp:Transcript_18859/g.45523  ORF Transcript_18859/g.45523 Transcript_18859/m.45523 type:complete len:106 (+) Transcript_18859:529-846(+)